MLRSISDLERALAANLTALDSSEYRQQINERWHESRIPLTAIEDSAGFSHLAFSVSVENAPIVDDGQGASGESVTVLADTVVLFAFKIVPSNKNLSYANASIAAADVLSAILRPSDDYQVLPRQVFKPGFIQDSYMPVELRFSILFDLQLPDFR
jgi:hypothetical protein